MNTHVLINKFTEEETQIEYDKNKSKIITALIHSLTEFDNYLLDEDKQAVSKILSISHESDFFSIILCLLIIQVSLISV